MRGHAPSHSTRGSLERRGSRLHKSWRRREPFAHTDPFLDLIAKPLIEADHPGVASNYLQVDFNTPERDQAFFSFAD
jgi:hypothetical protein